MQFIKKKYLSLSRGFKKQLKNLSWLFAEKFINVFFAMVAGIWVARYLGPEKFGTYNYALSIVTIFAPFLGLGLNGIVVRDIVRENQAKDEILGTAFVLKLLSGIIIVILSLLLVRYLRPEDNLTLTLVGILSVGNIFLSFDVISFWFASQINSKYAVISKTITNTIYHISRILLIKFNLALIAFAIAATLQKIIQAIGLNIANEVRGYSMRQWSFRLGKASQLMRESWPLVFSGIAIIIQAKIDQIMLGQMIGDIEVGQYTAALKLIEVFAFIPTVICQSVAPEITKAKSINERLYFNRLENIYRIMFSIFLVLAISVILLSDQIILLTYGKAYQSASILLSLGIVRFIFTSFGTARSLFIMNESLFRYALFTAIIGSIINIGMNYILIPHYAAVGAIIATIVSFATTTFILDYFFARPRQNLSAMVRAVLTFYKLNNIK